MSDKTVDYMLNKRSQSSLGSLKPNIASNSLSQIKRSSSSLGYLQTYSKSKASSNFPFVSFRPSSTLFILNASNNRSGLISTPFKKSVNTTQSPTNEPSGNFRFNIINLIQFSQMHFLIATRPKISVITLAFMGILYLGIELLFSMETALTVPILLKLQVPEE